MSHPELTVTVTITYLKCRICLIDFNQNQLLSLFSKNEHFDQSLTNADLIMACSSVNISKQDGFPQHICEQCYRKLSQLYEFKQLCENSDKVLHDKIKIFDNVKYELNDDEYLGDNDTDKKDNGDGDDDDDNNNNEELIIKREHVCKTCSQQFNDDDSLKYHLSISDCNSSLLSHMTMMKNINRKGESRMKDESHHLKIEYLCDVNDTHTKLCVICNEYFDNFVEHMKVTHSLFACHQCFQTFENDEQLVHHHHHHDNASTKQQCPLCNEYVKNLLRHHTKVHKTSNKCPKCDKSFTISRYFMKHMKRHCQDNTKHLCPYCGRAFKELGNLKQHIRIHTGEKPYECEFCPKKFAQWSSLRSHRVVHTGEKNYACEICGKAFSRLVTLNKHLTSHSDERNFPCEICGRKFKHSRSVKEHMVIHTGIKNHKCEYCDKAFGFKKNLVVHRRTHTGDKPYLCALCTQAFTQRHCLRAHMKSHHKQQL